VKFFSEFIGFWVFSAACISIDAREPLTELQNCKRLVNTAWQNQNTEKLCLKALAASQDRNNRLAATMFLADLYDRRGELKSAFEFYRRADAIEKKQTKRDPGIQSFLQGHIARLASQLDFYGISDSVGREVLALRENLLGEQDASTIASVIQLGSNLLRQEKYGEAEVFFDRALDLKSKVHGSSDDEKAVVLNNLGHVYLHTERTEKAGLVFERALKVQESKFGPQSKQVTVPLNSLGLLYTKQKKYDLAEKLFLRSLQIRETLSGKEAPAVATALNNLANVYVDQGQCEKALPLLKRAVHISTITRGSDHSATKISRDNLLVCAKN
jgi:tetratricopeptide (TPR) repeat protein